MDVARVIAVRGPRHPKVLKAIRLSSKVGFPIKTLIHSPGLPRL